MKLINLMIFSAVFYLRTCIFKIRIMQSYSESIICFTWREISAFGAGVQPCGNIATFESDYGEGTAGDVLEHFAISQLHKHNGGEYTFNLGRGLSGSQRLVHRYVPESMRFSYR